MIIGDAHLYTVRSLLLTLDGGTGHNMSFGCDSDGSSNDTITYTLVRGRTRPGSHGSGLRRFLIRARPPGQLLAIDRTNLHGPLFLPYLFCRFPLISGNQSIQAGASFREFRPHTLTHWRIRAPREDAALCSLRGHHNPILFYRSI